MRKPKTLTELIEGLTWFNDIEKTKEILRKLVAGTSGGKTYLEEGTNITLVGEGTEEDPIIISSTGGGSGSTDYISNVEVSGQTMTFTGVGNAFSGDVTLPSGGGGGTTLQVYSESGTLAGGDARATIGDFSFVQNPNGSGLNYNQFLKAISLMGNQIILGSSLYGVEVLTDRIKIGSNDFGLNTFFNETITIGDISLDDFTGGGIIYDKSSGQNFIIKSNNISIMDSEMNGFSLNDNNPSINSTINKLITLKNDVGGVDLDISNITGTHAQSFQDKPGTIALLPTSQGTAGQFLQTDGNDNVVWATPSGGSGGSTNLGYTPSTNQGTVTSSTGTSATLPLFSTGVAGLVPARVGTVTTKFLREDGTWVTPTNTTYGAGTLAILNTGTSTTTSVYTPKDLNDWLVGKSYATQTSLATVLPINTANTNTTISLTTSGGNLCNMGSANSNTTYTTTGTVLNAYAKVLINAATEPTVTGATKIKGATFTASTNMYMIVNYTGASRGVEYYFLEI